MDLVYLDVGVCLVLDVFRIRCGLHWSAGHVVLLVRGCELVGQHFGKSRVCTGMVIEIAPYLLIILTSTFGQLSPYSQCSLMHMHMSKKRECCRNI